MHQETGVFLVNVLRLGIWMILQQAMLSQQRSHIPLRSSEVVFVYMGLNWKDYVVIDKRYLRPAVVDNLKGESSKVRKVLR